LLSETVRENLESDAPAKTRLYNLLDGFWQRVKHMMSELEQLFAVSLDEEIKLLGKQKQDMSLVEALQMEVREHWRRLSNHYEALKLDIKEESFDNIEL
jgi:hypothetical protein